jgi:hypothetical protein
MQYILDFTINFTLKVHHAFHTSHTPRLESPKCTKQACRRDQQQQEPATTRLTVTAVTGSPKIYRSYTLVINPDCPSCRSTQGQEVSVDQTRTDHTACPPLAAGVIHTYNITTTTTTTEK